MLNLSILIQQWETAGSHLASALEVFLESCQALEGSILDSVSAKYLLPKVDPQLDFLNNEAAQQLIKARALVGHVRNRIIPPIFRLPGELLSRIFESSIYFARYHNNCRDHIRVIYGQINILSRVCIAWRDLILGRSEFWSLVPVGTEFHENMTRLCIERTAGSQALHLVADLNYGMPATIKAVLTERAHRIQTLNLTLGRPEGFSSMVDYFFNHSSPGTLTELSFCVSQTKSGSVPAIFPRDSPRQTRLNRFIEPLRALRLCGVTTYAGAMSFSSLEELRIDNVNVELLPHGVPARGFLPVSAPKLRILHIINCRDGRVRTANGDSDAPVDTKPHASHIFYPSLKELFLGDLEPRMLKILLGLIAPGSYSFTLHLTKKTLDPGKLPNELHSVVREHNLTELSLRSSNIHTSYLRPLLQSFPSVTILHLDEQYFGRSTSEALTAPPEASVSHTTNFPRLHALYLKNVRIGDRDAFRAMVSSHPLERLQVNLTGCLDEEYSGCGHQNPAFTDELAIWLQATIPQFYGYEADDMTHLVSGYDKWQLW